MKFMMKNNYNNIIKRQFERPMYSYDTTINPAELDEYIKNLERIRDLLVEIGNLQKTIDNINNLKLNEIIGG